MPTQTSPGPPGRRTARWTVGASVALALLATSACALVDAVAPTAYCTPKDPVVTPQRVSPGGEVHVETVGNHDGVDCETRLPAQARYQVRIRSETPADDPDEGYLSADLGVLDPSSNGDAEGTFRVPDDFPVDEAEISLRLDGAKTICDIDPSIGCAKNPFARIDVVG